MRWTWLAATLATVFAATSTPNGLGVREDDLTFECSKDGIELTRLIDVANEVTGEPFFYDPRDVRDEKVFFSGVVVVPRAVFLSFFDSCMQSTDFIHVEKSLSFRVRLCASVELLAIFTHCTANE